MRDRRYGKRKFGTYQGGHYAGRRHWLRNVILLLVGLGLICFGALQIVIAVNDTTRLVGEPEVMVIFGCQVRPDGPSILLRDRLDTALDYLEDHPDMRIVVSGGKGDNEHISEAQAMYDYLTEHGVDGEQILMEDQSHNTWQNVNNTLVLMQREGWDITADVVLVSSGFHLARIQMLWDRRWSQADKEYFLYDDQQISTLNAPVSHFPSAVQMFFREPLALVKSFVFDR